MLVYDSKHCWDNFFLISGRFDLNKAIVQCTKCKTVLPSQSLTDVVQTGYWPGSPTDTSYLFDQRLFQLWDSIQKRMPGTSESSFVRALEDVSVMNGRVWFFIVFIFLHVSGFLYLNVLNSHIIFLHRILGHYIHCIFD